MYRCKQYLDLETEFSSHLHELEIARSIEKAERNVC